MGGCASTKAPYNCFQLKRGVLDTENARWDDNRALREAGLEELTKEQLWLFHLYWEQVYVSEILAMPPEVQNAVEIAMEERRNDPGKAEAYKTLLR